MSILEALGAGVPVIATRACPWGELTTHKCGWWIESNERALIDCIEQVVQLTAGQLSEMGERGKKLIRAKYTWQTIAQQTYQLYQYLVLGGERPNLFDK